MHSLFRWLIVGSFVALLYGCDKEPEIPTIETRPPTSVTTNSAIVRGEILVNGGADITSRGVCWSTDPDPDISDNIILAFRTNPFTCTITDLNPNTTYWARTYATNIAGTGYGRACIIKTWYGSVKDTDYNTYYTVKIGSQVWMTENLKTTRLSDGTKMQMITDFESREDLMPWYSYYNYDVKFKQDYGALYNWSAVITDKLCPYGWHVSTDNEWDILIIYLGGPDVAGGKLKEVGTEHWKGPNSEASNESGFTALPGAQLGLDYAGQFGRWWAFTGIDEYVSYRTLSYLSGIVFRNYVNISNPYYYPGEAYSVRCVKDSV
jgi:uncharacterized protein (TIGR02145 family)